MDVFNPSALAPFFIVRNSVVGVGITTPKQVVSSNGNRILLVFSSQNILFSLNAGVPVGNTFGLVNAFQASPFIVKFADWGGITGGEWWALQNGGGGNINICEVIYQPQGGE